MLKNYTLKVASVIQETADAVTICFKQPGLKKINYLPGQYLTLIVNINNRRYRRPYSLSSAHGLDTTLNVTVKRVPHGVVSNYLCDSVKEGDIIEVNEPLGDFVYHKPSAQVSQVVLWGAGSGITPLFSILKATLKNTSNVNATLVYINHQPDSAIFLDDLLMLRSEHPERFTMHNFYTRCVTNHEDAFCYNSRLEHANIKKIVSGVKQNGDSLHYICGPSQLKTVLKEHLSAFDIPAECIYSEDFDHVVDEAQLQDVHTAEVEIQFQHTTSAIEVVRGKSILEAALDRGIDLPYSCQNGSCKLCKATLVSGNVKMIGADVHTNGLEPNEKLLCCSYPLSHNVEVRVE